MSGVFSGFANHVIKASAIYNVDSLDLSSHSSITEIYCPNNLLSYMDVRNGNANNITVFNTF